MKAMKRIASLVVILLFSSALVQASELIQVGPFELHNSFWMSLHQTLIADASGFAELDRSRLSEDESEIWAESVAAYASLRGGGSLYFSDAAITTSDTITQLADDASVFGLDAPLAEALQKAAPIYRKQWWPVHRKSNEFFRAWLGGMLEEAGAELIARHEQVYGENWPELVRVYISPWGGALGAYTISGRAGGWISTLSSLDPSHQGFAGLELVFHETSHSIVHPRRGRVAKALSEAAGAGNQPPRDLWHAILFATTSELTRRYLAERGVDYVPFSEDLLTRVWSMYREPIERHWIPYLDGEGTLDAAIRSVVSETMSR